MTALALAAMFDVSSTVIVSTVIVSSTVIIMRAI